jgi:endoglucanase
MILRGVNIGNWFLMEGYISGGRNIPEGTFKTEFEKIYGRKELDFFESKFRDIYITKADFKVISSWGGNCVRLPFHYEFFETSPYKYSKESLAFVEKILSWADEYNLKIILDLHAACGSQNCDWHSDSSGKALLWENEKYRDRTYSLWEYLASNLKDEKALYGYDILNEPVISQDKLSTLKKFYGHAVKAIRRSDKKNKIFLEGNNWAQQIDFLADILSENVSISIHTYQPLNFTFNFIRGCRYPGKIDNTSWDKSRIAKGLKPYKEFSEKNNCDVLVGEFGVNYRGGDYGETRWLADILSVFNEFGFGWMYWTYKAVSQGVFPDGIMQYNDNPAWIRREGPIYGLENLYNQWPRHKKGIMDSWNTKHFSVNQDILDVLQKYFYIKK